jgi:hypothetical protein
MKTRRAVLFALAFAAASAAPSLAWTPKSITVNMTAMNNSGENGTAVLMDDPHFGVSVRINLSGAPDGVAQPAVIHAGTCGNINPRPELPIKPVIDGRTLSTIPGINLEHLTKGHYSLIVHKSSSAFGTYVSCGNIS